MIASMLSIPAAEFHRAEDVSRRTSVSATSSAATRQSSTIQRYVRMRATTQLELKARTFDYAKRFPDSDRIKQRGIATPKKNSINERH
jgi:hypothetical protein